MKKYVAKVELRGMPLYIVDKCYASGLYGKTRDETVEILFLKYVEELMRTELQDNKLSAKNLRAVKGILEQIVDKTFAQVDSSVLGLSKEEAKKRGYI